MPGRDIRRGEIWWVAFDPSIGGETRKTRPAVVVSNDEFNVRNNRVQVLPLTSSEKRLYLFEAHVNTGERQSKAMADQIRTVSKERFQNRIGRVSRAEMAGIERAIRVQLDLG
ncbi:MAG: type II toxin-antitoxin system PemK/MazF family toxin [Rhodoplanes sp.]